MSSELQLDVCCRSCCGGDIWWTHTKERQAWCCLQLKLCDPCLSALYVPWCEKAPYKYLSFPFSPVSRRSVGQDACCPVSSVTACWVHVMQPGMEMCGICTFAGVNFLDESVPESRNLRLKFQHLSGGDTRCWVTNCGAVGCLVF